MSQKYRLSTGGCVDRQRPLTFTFNGETLQGFAGDTVASALLANGVNVVGRSFKYRRPRGIVTAGPEEPNAIFTIGSGALHTPNVRATLTKLEDGMTVRSQSGWPSVNMDVGAVLGTVGMLLPAGFYYKTFMWPPKLWMFYEKIIRRFAFGGKAPSENDPDAYIHHHAHCDVLIIGGGPAGLAAALTAGKSGANVILAEMNSELGGDLLNDDGEMPINGQSAADWLRDAKQVLNGMENTTVITSTTVQGYHDYNALIAIENVSQGSGKLRQRLWKIRAKQVVVAAGAIERPPVFADSDVPGVMTANAVRTYINRYGVLPGHNILFFTNNDSAYAAALAAVNAGARVEVADIRCNADGYWQQRARDAGITMRLGYGICGVRRTGGLLATKLAELAPGGDALQADKNFLSHAYDAIAVSGGWTPTAHLFSQSRGELVWDKQCGAFIPSKAHPLNSCRACGAANAVFSLSSCLREGAEVGAAAANAAGFSSSATAPTTTPAPLECASLFVPFVPTFHPLGKGPGKHFVDWMNDVTAADIILAAREGYESVEHMKRYTAAGFGTDQGKTGNINALCLLAHVRGQAPEDIGHTTFRPNYTPMPFGAITGFNRRELYAPVRRTPLHSWHTTRGAVFEDVGEWKRPCYFPTAGENMAAATARECRAARNEAGIMDASTLGKIDIQGPDAAEFLDMIYTNNMSSLKNGYCRYGMMLREDGMIFDDGVAMRIDDGHFHITTSTGHAASVMNWLEEWLQTERPDLRVFCTSVTEQWTVIALVGPKSRDILSAVTDISLTTEDFPFMSMREGAVAGVRARVCRVSFSGELSYEINVPSRYGLHVWETLMAAGEPHHITPYGTETMRVLRA
ncbi:2Fe-2S iron-sulfur cluster-binding protein, partial [Candidatus Persebacteraceae bacterium Df01]|nr:2Fe-2S iron-sulfur cluster-binding protein [Candidatus Persebacteraceae bacterium Df01]